MDCEVSSYISLNLTLKLDPVSTVIMRGPKKVRKKCRVSWWSCLHAVLPMPSVPINREANGQITLDLRLTVKVFGSSPMITTRPAVGLFRHVPIAQQARTA